MGSNINGKSAFSQQTISAHLLLPPLRLQREHRQVGPVRVPVEGHVGRAGRDEVPMGAVAANRLKDGQRDK